MKRRIILAGGGHAHLAVLADWARRPVPDSERWLITSARHTAYSGMLPGWLAGLYRAEALMIDLQPLAEQAGAHLILEDVVGLDAPAQRLSLSSGDDATFDLLSLATGGETDISALAALGDRLLPVRPVDLFMDRWNSFMRGIEDASQTSVAIIGGGAAGVELALGAERALRARSGANRIALVTPSDAFLASHAPSVRRRVMAELEQRRVDVHFAHASGVEGGLLLSNGQDLRVDCAIAATGSRAPRWLAKSGISLTSAGFIAVGGDLRSSSHTNIFAAGDIIDRVDRTLERSGVHAVKAGPVLAANLRATMTGKPLSLYQPRRRTLYLLALGDQRAILSWGRLGAVGAWVWRVKDWIDRSFVARYSRASKQG